jgi:hypothetical protein
VEEMRKLLLFVLLAIFVCFAFSAETTEKEAKKENTLESKDELPEDHEEDKDTDEDDTAVLFGDVIGLGEDEPEEGEDSTTEETKASTTTSAPS